MTASPDSTSSKGPSFSPAKPCVIGILGGVAAGKSAVARAFAARGLVHVDADAIARNILARQDILARIREEFGVGTVDDQGLLDRPRLAAIVFQDADRRRALEAITHPPIHTDLQGAIDRARNAGASVVLDIPLLLENGWGDQCDRLVFVQTSQACRQQRARARGWAEGELERREAAQLPLADKRRAAGNIIDNDGTLERTQAQVDELLRQWGKPR